MVMVHGWMDVAASYQFVVDAFAHDHYVIAPDWRGYGSPGSALHAPGAGPADVLAGTDSYWFPDYLADLDFLIDHYSPDAPVHLVGHSMGGNVAMLYAGVRPAAHPRGWSTWKASACRPAGRRRRPSAMRAGWTSSRPSTAARWRSRPTTRRRRGGRG